MYTPRKRKTPLAPVIVISALSVAGIIAGIVALQYLSNRRQDQAATQAPQARQPRASVDTSPRIEPNTVRVQAPEQPKRVAAELKLKKDDRLSVEAIKLQPNIYGQMAQENVGHVVALASNHIDETITRAVIEFYFRDEDGGYLKTKPAEVRYVPPLGEVHVSQAYSGLEAESVEPDYQVTEVKTKAGMACFEVELHYDAQDKRISGWVRNETPHIVGNPALIVDFLGAGGQVVDTLTLTDLGEKFPDVLDAGARGFINAPAHPRSYVAGGRVSCRLFDKPAGTE
jgi:hypothetical protein